LAPQITEVDGSGPFKFVKEEWQPGHRVVYVKNPDYVPRAEPPDNLAGGKVAKVDRVEWLYIPEPVTAIQALETGEVDYLNASRRRLVRSQGQFMSVLTID
jgi:peptide/nickel transport system substrate-binding protein